MPPKPVRFRMFPLGGKSNQCPPPLLWSDVQCSLFLAEVKRRTHSVGILRAEYLRLLQPEMKCRLREKSYETLLQHSTSKPKMQEKFYEEMCQAKLTPSVRHFNNLLEGKSRSRDLRGALRIMDLLKESGIAPTSQTLSMLLFASYSAGKHRLTQSIVSSVLSTKEHSGCIDGRFLSAAVSTAHTVPLGEGYLKEMSNRGFRVTKAHRESLLSACIAELNAERAVKIIKESGGMSAKTGSKLLRIYSGLMDAEHVVKVAEHILAEVRPLDPAFFCQAIDAFAGFAVERGDEWVLLAEKFFAAFLADDTVRRQQHLESVLERMLALHIKLSDVGRLHSVRVALQREGYHNWTPRILAVAKQVVASQVQRAHSDDGAEPGVPELAVNNSFSSGVGVAGGHILPYASPAQQRQQDNILAGAVPANPAW